MVNWKKNQKGRPLCTKDVYKRQKQWWGGYRLSGISTDVFDAHESGCKVSENDPSHGEKHPTAARISAMCIRERGDACIVALTNDDSEASVDVNLPIPGSSICDLISGQVLPVENGRVHMVLQGHEGRIYQVK